MRYLVLALARLLLRYRYKLPRIFGQVKKKNGQNVVQLFSDMRMFLLLLNYECLIANIMK
jgi:hypothetical protein